MINSELAMAGSFFWIIIGTKTIENQVLVIIYELLSNFLNNFNPAYSNDKSSTIIFLVLKSLSLSKYCVSSSLFISLKINKKILYFT